MILQLISSTINLDFFSHRTIIVATGVSRHKKNGTLKLMTHRLPHDLEMDGPDRTPLILSARLKENQKRKKKEKSRSAQTATKWRRPSPPPPPSPSASSPPRLAETPRAPGASEAQPGPSSHPLLPAHPRRRPPLAAAAPPPSPGCRSATPPRPWR